MRYLFDTRTSTIGQLVGRMDAQLLLKPLGGGREWCCPPERAREPTTTERVRAGVAVANARSTAGRPS